MGSLAQDIGQASRTLTRRPAFSAAVVLSLGLGVGAAAAVFSLVDTILLKPLPYPASDRLVRIFEQNSPMNRFGLSVADFLGIEESQRSLQSVAAVRPADVIVAGGEGPERVRALWATSGFFQTLGIRPAEGRGFRPGEDREGADRVVVLGHAFRDRYFGPGARVLGRTLNLDGRSYTVVGVMPAGVEDLAGIRGDLWPALQLETPTRRGPFLMIGIGRLKPGLRLVDAERDLAGVSRRLYAIWAQGFADETARLTPRSLHEDIVRNVRRTLLLVFGAVALVLLIAVANIANLTLIRATEREREGHVRAAVGAGRAGLARWLITESVLLAVVGGLAGVFFSVVFLELCKRLGPTLPRLAEVSIDARVVAFAMAATVLAAAVFGLAPLASGSLGRLSSTLRARGLSADRRTRSLRGGLVALEFALTLPILIGAGLLLRSLARLESVNPGFDPAGVVTAGVSLPPAKYPDPMALEALWRDALARMEDTPGVRAVAFAGSLPPDDPGSVNNFDLLEKPVPEGAAQPVSPWAPVTPDYFRALCIPLVEGRLFDSRDTNASPLVALVSRSWARRFFGNESAVGKQMYGGGCTICGPITIVGVVGDVKYMGLSGSDDAVYTPFTQETWGTMNLIVRTDGPPAAVVGLLRGALRSIDPEVPLARVATMEELVDDSVATPRRWTAILTAFAALAMLLSAMGIFAVLSYYVTRQRSEIGIRMALGADPGTIVRGVMRRGLILSSVGGAVGLATALYATRWVQALLFRTGSTDLPTFGAAAGALAVLALLASYVPARRAAAIDPAGAIAAE